MPYPPPTVDVPSERYVDAMLNNGIDHETGDPFDRCYRASSEWDDCCGGDGYGHQPQTTDGCLVEALTDTCDHGHPTWPVALWLVVP